MTHLVGHRRGEAPRVTGEVVRNLFDGLDGARAHVNGHVLLDADGGFLAFALCHACGPARSLLPKPKTEKRKKKDKQTHPPCPPPFCFFGRGGCCPERVSDGWTGPGVLWMSPHWSTMRSGGCCCVFQCCPQIRTILSDSLTHTLLPTLSLCPLPIPPHCAHVCAAYLKERESRESGVCVSVC